MNFSEWLCVHVCGGPAEKAFLWHAVTVLGHHETRGRGETEAKFFGEKVVAPFFPAFLHMTSCINPPFTRILLHRGNDEDVLVIVCAMRSSRTIHTCCSLGK